MLVQRANRASPNHMLPPPPAAASLRLLPFAQVEQTSSAAQEESSFLAEHLQGLLDERQALKEQLEKASREKDYLVQENELLRQELLGEYGWSRGWVQCGWMPGGCLPHTA